MYRLMTTANHAAHAAMRVQVIAPSAQAVQVVTVLRLLVAPVLHVRPWAPIPLPQTEATSRLKLPLVVMPRKPPLSASAKPRQLQQLTVPRPSNRLEHRRI